MKFRFLLLEDDTDKSLLTKRPLDATDATKDSKEATANKGDKGRSLGEFLEEIKRVVDGKADEDYYAFVGAMYYTKYEVNRRAREQGQKAPSDKQQAENILKYHNDILEGQCKDFYDSKPIKEILSAVLPLYYKPISFSGSNTKDIEEEILNKIENTKTSRYEILYLVTRFDDEIKTAKNADKVFFVLNCYSNGKMEEAMKDEEYQRQIFNTPRNYNDNDTNDFKYIYSAYTLAFKNGQDPSNYLTSKVGGHFVTIVEAEEEYEKVKKAKKKEPSSENDWVQLSDRLDLNNKAALLQVARKLDDTFKNTGADSVRRVVGKEVFGLGDNDIDKIDFVDDVALKLPPMAGEEWGKGEVDTRKAELIRLLKNSRSWKEYFDI